MNSHLVSLLLMSFLLAGCNREAINAAPDSDRIAPPVLDVAPTNVSEHGHRVNYIFTDDLNFREVKLFHENGSPIGTTTDESLVAAIVQSISGATPTSAIEMAFPIDHFKTHMTVELVHFNAELNVTLRYDQGFVDPQMTPSDGICWLPDGDTLGPFIRKHSVAKDAE